MKKYWKGALIIGLIGGAALLYNVTLQTPDVGTAKSRIVRDDVLNQLREFKVIRNDIPEEEAQRYREQFDASVASLDEGLAVVERQGPDSLFAIYWPLLGLGSLHRTLGAYGKAESAFLYALEIQSEAFLPLGNLAELYNRNYLNYPKALEYYKKAVAIGNVDEGYLDTYYSDMYEMVRYRMNDEKGAEQLLIDGIKQHPNDTNIVALLALHYRQLNMIDEAISRYRELLVKKPDSQVAQKALKDLGVEF